MKIIFEIYTITSKFTGNKAATWDANNYNHHKVTVRNTETSKSATFDFWGSIVNPEIQTRRDLLNAMCCWLSDAAAGIDSFEDFCYSSGYDTDSIKVLKTYEACQKALKQAERVTHPSTFHPFFWWENLNLLANRLQEEIDNDNSH